MDAKLKQFELNNYYYLVLVEASYNPSFNFKINSYIIFKNDISSRLSDENLESIKILLEQSSNKKNLISLLYTSKYCLTMRNLHILVKNSSSEDLEMAHFPLDEIEKLCHE